MWVSIFLYIAQNYEDLKTFQILTILILRIIPRKPQNSKKKIKVEENSKNKNVSEY